MMADLDVLATFVKNNFPADAHMPDLQVYAANSAAACPAGKVLMVTPGNCPVLERTMCGKALVIVICSFPEQMTK